MVHVKCRDLIYPFGKIKRLYVPDHYVPWNISWSDYNPPEYTSEYIKGKPWADPNIDDTDFKPVWNVTNDKTDRRSYLGEYLVVSNVPMNPMGRTGLRGRGVLGRWGPNHAADPVVTRWKRSSEGIKIMSDLTSLPILQFCAIQRRDNDQWAIPGGMIDPGEKVSTTLKREFLEEACNYLQSLDDDKTTIKKLVDDFFANGTEIYRGYVDDPRNTDNAWIETVVYNFHDNTGSSVGRFRLKAGDDAINIKWIDIKRDVKLYANHNDFINLVVQKYNAHW